MPKLFKIMFFSLNILSTLIIVSSPSWFMMWLGMEFNLLSVIPLFSNSKNLYPTEASMKYFIVQVLASTIFLFSILLNNWFFYEMDFNNFLPKLLMISALLMKLGMAPFHSWFPEVMSGLSWLNCLLLMTWQKLGPMIVLMTIQDHSFMLIFTIILSSLMSGVLGINQMVLPKIMAYSSINHMAWMLMSTMTSKTIWLLYFAIYCLINSFLVLSFLKWKTFQLNQLVNLKTTFSMKFLTSLNFLVLAGLPPFIGFLPKWLVIESLVGSINLVIPLILVVSTMISIFVYLRISILMLMNKSESNPNWENLNSNFWLVLSNWVFISTLMISNLMF